MSKPCRPKISWIMKKVEFVENVEKYESPQVEVLEVEVEMGFAISSNMENVKEGEETDWW